MSTLKKLQLAGAVALLSMPLMATAATKATPTDDASIANATRLNELVGGGYGVSYKARLKIDKNAYKYANKIVIKTDDVISPAGWASSETIKVPATGSMGWNDSATNPDIPSCSATVTTGCVSLTLADLEKSGFGWGHTANWWLVDLNDLTSVASVVSVHVTVERYNDGVAEETSTSATGVVTKLASDDDFVPGVTVWRGNQNDATHTHWFPSRNQATKKFDGSPGSTFWARKLSIPTSTVGKKSYALTGMSSKAVGWDSAFYGDGKTAMVEGEFALNKKDPSQNFLTVVIGGDARHDVASKKHSANYKLTVEVHKPGM